MASLVDPAVLQAVADELSAMEARCTPENLEVSPVRRLFRVVLRVGSSCPSGATTPHTHPCLLPRLLLFNSHPSACSPLSPPQPRQQTASAARKGADEAAATFEYARLAVFSDKEATRREALSHLSSLAAGGFRPSETAFWLAAGQMQSGQFSGARETLSDLVRRDPANERAAALLEIYKRRVKEEGWKGLAMTAGGVALAVAILVLGVWAWRRGGAEKQSVGEWVRMQGVVRGAGDGVAVAGWRGSSGSSSASSGSSSSGTGGRYGSRY
jgi:hypothetical protein